MQAGTRAHALTHSPVGAGMLTLTGIHAHTHAHTRTHTHTQTPTCRHTHTHVRAMHSRACRYTLTSCTYPLRCNHARSNSHGHARSDSHEESRARDNETLRTVDPLDVVIQVLHINGVDREK